MLLNQIQRLDDGLLHFPYRRGRLLHLILMSLHLDRLKGEGEVECLTEIRNKIIVSNLVDVSLQCLAGEKNWPCDDGRLMSELKGKQITTAIPMF